MRCPRSTRQSPAESEHICAWRSPISRARAWARDRQAVAHIGEVVFDVAVQVVLRIERDAANLAVAGDKAAAGRAHSAPLRAVDRHRGEDAQRRGEHLGSNALARALHVTARAGEIELTAALVEILLSVFVRLECSR